METLMTSSLNICDHSSMSGLSDDKKQRLLRAQEFLNTSDFKNFTIEFLAGDCSNRTYYRMTDHGKNYVLMDAPPPENPQQFCDLSNYLLGFGFSTPKILAQDFQNGFLVIEDFGSKTYSNLILNGQDPYPLYQDALKVVVELETGKIENPKFVMNYTVEKMLDEALIFIDWYWAYVMNLDPLENLADNQNYAKARQSFIDVWAPLLTDACNALPKTLVLRDFHIDNLMLLDRPGVQACGLLDFQDALWGPIGYDFVSLIQDARIKIHPNLKNQLWEDYLKSATMDINVLQTNIMILSAARHLKILGIFMRMYLRANRPSYLKFLPNVWDLLQECFISPVLKPASLWILQNLPQNHHPNDLKPITQFFEPLKIIGARL